jgi:hypothetical protein
MRGVPKTDANPELMPVMRRMRRSRGSNRSGFVSRSVRDAPVWMAVHSLYGLVKGGHTVASLFFSYSGHLGS